MAPASADAVVHDEEFIDAFYKFAMEYHSQDLAAILLKQDDDQHYAVQISLQELHGDERFETLANLLCSKPRTLLPLFDEALRKAEVDIADVHELQEDMSFKPYVHARISLMECAEMKPSISRIRCHDIGRILAVRGTIIRTGAVKMLEGEREYDCSKCKLRFKVKPQLEQDNKLTLPATCPSDRTKPCKGVTFTYVEESKICHDYQEIKIQEEMHGLGVGSVPRSIVAVLEDDLVDCCKAGDDVEVTGVLCCKWKPVMKGVRCDLELVVMGNNIRKASADKAAVDLSVETVEKFEEYWRQHLDCPLKGRNGILKGICPQVYGLFTVKLAVALTLIGGVARVDKSGTKVRGEPHLLIVGDPGTGKSQFMKYAAKLSARSVMTTGMGSTGAGLTVTAVKDNGEWMLEAGALVLADGGLCCIDEFDGIRECDRATIHEAMEQQTLSVAKAGLVTTLNTRCTVFAVCNPKGQYDPDNTLEVNTSLAAPLLSRFDIVLVLLDTKNPDWDRIVSTHILNEHKNAHRADDPDAPPSDSTPSAFWTIDMLRSYVYYVKAAFNPTLTPEAERVIVNYYQLQRRSNAGNRNQARTTIRMLESLVRLAQAHARLMFRHVVLRTDAVVAVVAVESSMTTSAILENMTNALHSSFKDQPDDDYNEIEAQILERLGIPIPSEEERAAERTRGRQEESTRGDENGEQETGEALAEKSPRVIDGQGGAEVPGRDAADFNALGGCQSRGSESLEALGSPVALAEEQLDGGISGGTGGPLDERVGEESQDDRGRQDGDRTGQSGSATWHANAQLLKQQLTGFDTLNTTTDAGGQGADVNQVRKFLRGDVSMPRSDVTMPESDASKALNRSERNVSMPVSDVSRSHRNASRRPDVDAAKTTQEDHAGDHDERSVGASRGLGPGDAPGTMQPGVATGRDQRRAEALKMLDEFDDELLQAFDFSGGSDSPVGTELPLCLSPLRRSSGETQLSGGHVSSGEARLERGHVSQGEGRRRSGYVSLGEARPTSGPMSRGEARQGSGHVSPGEEARDVSAEASGRFGGLTEQHVEGAERIKRPAVSGTIHWVQGLERGGSATRGGPRDGPSNPRLEQTMNRGGEEPGERPPGQHGHDFSEPAGGQPGTTGGFIAAPGDVQPGTRNGDVDNATTSMHGLVEKTGVVTNSPEGYEGFGSGGRGPLDGRPLSATSGRTSGTRALMRSLTQRLVRPSQHAQAETSGVNLSRPRPRTENTGGQGSDRNNTGQHIPQPLSNRAANVVGSVAPLETVGLLRKRVVRERSSSNESEGQGWLSDEQWGISSPGKKARNG